MSESETEDGLAALSHRPDVREMTRAAETAVLAPVEPGGLPDALRRALASRIAALSGEAETARGYAFEGGFAAVCHPGFAGGGDPWLRAVLTFCDLVTMRPRDAVADDVEVLRTAGLSDADIVRLAELTAFFAYRLRLAAGLRLLKDAG